MLATLHTRLLPSSWRPTASLSLPVQELEQLLAVFNTRNPLCLQHLLRNLPATLYQPEAYRPNRMTIQATVVSLQSLPGLLCVFTIAVVQHLESYLLHPLGPTSAPLHLCTHTVLPPRGEAGSAWSDHMRTVLFVLILPFFDAAGRVPTDPWAEAGPAGAAEHLPGALDAPGAAAAAGSPTGATATGFQQQ